MYDRLQLVDDSSFTPSIGTGNDKLKFVVHRSLLLRLFSCPHPDNRLELIFGQLHY
jgi:hypothetical protein